MLLDVEDALNEVVEVVVALQQLVVLEPVIRKEPEVRESEVRGVAV